MSHSDEQDILVPPQLLQMIEAILMVAQGPVSPQEISTTTGIELPAVVRALEILREEYDGKTAGRARGFELRETDGCWRIYSRPEWFEAVRSFTQGVRSGRLSQAALETLAIVAYRQPITRAQISQIRGVNVDSVVRNLLLRDLIEEIPGEAGKAGQYGTTIAFLEAFGLRSLADLPPLAPNFPTVETLPEVIEEIEEYK
ncbi:SMC-Scp complex subunit ScpB [Actinomycetaceae bacterium TAE3-ERU4]|nr:SMC-Scp complex subunit ScpB [Actinomycetaceae bacterium TAE3-ERU4]